MLTKNILMKCKYLLLLVTLLFTACTPQAIASAIPTSSLQATATLISTSAPTSTPAPTATEAPIPTVMPTATLDHGVIPPELVGTWSFMAFGDPWTAVLTADGTYSLYPPDGQLDIGGSFGISGNEAVFRDEIRGQGQLCVPAEARYHWELVGDRLMFTVIEDKCMVGRIEQWTAGWQRVKE